LYSKKVTIELDKKDTIVHWENLSDIHIGNENFQDELFDRRLRDILNDPYRFTSFGGDNWDLILPGDPRFKDEAVRSRTLAEQQDIFEEKCAELLDEHNTYVDDCGMEKIWYMQWGNHEYKSRVVTEGDMKRYCKYNKLTFLGSKAFLRLDIRYKNKSMMKKTLFVNHGAGGGKTLNALEALTINNEADIYQMGHLHDPMGIKRDCYYYDDRKNHWETKEQILVNSGCFVTAIRNNVDQWYEQKGNKMVTSKPGTWTVSFDAYNNKVSQHG
jgi:hypothetical protein